MLTKYERELVDYWKNWKSGMGPYKGTDLGIRKEADVNVTVNFDIENLVDELWDII